MRFANVNGQKVRMLLVILINLNDVAHLAAKWRSSETPKHQHQRPLMRALADVETADTIQRDDPRVGRIAAHFQRAAMHVRQRVAHHPLRVLRSEEHTSELQSRQYLLCR